jgi:signal transduction histidine kinase/CheY-like chemotaxis protein
LEINSALKNVSKGNYDISLKINSGTEVDEIAKNTIFMAKEIKQDLYEIEHLKSYMENILNSLNVAIITASKEGVLEFSNDYAKKIFDFDKISLIFDLIVKNNLNIYFDPNKLSENQDPIYFPDIEFKNRTFDIYIKAYKSSITAGTLIMAYDISKRKELEKSLSQIQRIQSLGLMASGIAHDFNNFLGTIQGYLELMQIATDAAERNNYSTKAYDSIYNAKNMVNKLLVFTKSSVRNKEILNLNDIVSTAIDMVSNSIGLKNIYFDFDKISDDIKIEMDKTDTLQIFTNLFLNAIQAIDKVGKITIKIKTLYIDSDKNSLRTGKYVKIIVNDNGSGIPKKDLEKIFDPFFTTKNSGTGLGMYVIRTIVEKNSGSINVLSKEGIGTTVEILLPLYSGSIQPKNINMENYYYGNGETLLLVDDDNNMRTVVKQMLEKLNYRVYDSEEVDKGLKIVKEKEAEISLIILDVLMPKKDAYEFLDTMLEEKIDVPVLLISGFTTKLPKIDKYPFYKAFLPKPFGMKTLSLMVAKNMKRRII